MDKNKLYKNITTIEKYLKNLDSFSFKNLNDFENRFNDYLSVSMSLFTILNASIEIGEALIDKNELEFPTSYRKVFEILGKNNIISKNLAKDLASFMYERNMIAHQYDDINIEDIYNLLNKREVFEKFISEIKQQI